MSVVPDALAILPVRTSCRKCAVQHGAPVVYTRTLAVAYLRGITQQLLLGDRTLECCAQLTLSSKEITIGSMVGKIHRPTIVSTHVPKCFFKSCHKVCHMSSVSHRQFCMRHQFGKQQDHGHDELYQEHLTISDVTDDTAVFRCEFLKIGVLFCSSTKSVYSQRVASCYNNQRVASCCSRVLCRHTQSSLATVQLIDTCASKPLTYMFLFYHQSLPQ